MAVMLERWNDDKMDALDAKVDGLGGQMREQRQEMRELRLDTKAGFERIDDRFERLYHVMIGTGGLIVAALIGVIATQ